MKKNRISIGQQIKDFAANIVVDPFGYEKIIHNNARNFAVSYSKELSTLPNDINLRIIHKKSLLLAFLYAKDIRIKQVDLSDLVSFFTGTKANASLEQKVTKGIFQFIDDYTKHNSSIPPEAISFHIRSNEDQTYIEVFKDQSSIEQLDVKKLIKYFR